LRPSPHQRRDRARQPGFRHRGLKKITMARAILQATLLTAAARPPADVPLLAGPPPRPVDVALGALTAIDDAHALVEIAQEASSRAAQLMAPPAAGRP
jgi:hypothetical protein